jgi:hypothetical protein
VIWYWTTWISKNGIRYADECILECYLEHSDVDASHFDKTMAVNTYAAELCNAKSRFKDVLADAIYKSDIYGVEVATARVERRYSHLTEEKIYYKHKNAKIGLTRKSSSVRLDDPHRSRSVSWDAK